MNRPHALRLLALGWVLFTAVAVLAWCVYRPWALTWGATDAEVALLLPGDSLVPSASFVATRGITIQAAPEDVWPWLVQMGYRRAGFYSYDRLDNDGVPSADSIMVEYQHLTAGDHLPLNGTVSAEVVRLERARTLLLRVGADAADGSAWTWLFWLDGAEDGSTRLLTRLRYNPPSLRARFMLEFFEIIMMRKCMSGLKRRAEALASARASMQPGAWTPSDGSSGSSLRWDFSRKSHGGSCCTRSWDHGGEPASG